MSTDQEAQVVKVTLLIIFLSLVIVYVAYFFGMVSPSSLSSGSIEREPFAVTPPDTISDESVNSSTRGTGLRISALPASSGTMQTGMIQNLSGQIPATMMQNDSLSSQIDEVNQSNEMSESNDGTTGAMSLSSQTGRVDSMMTTGAAVDVGTGDSNTGGLVSAQPLEDSLLQDLPDSDEIQDDAIVSEQSDSADISESTIVLSGTRLYYEQIAIVRELGLSPQYVLTDDTAYYAYLGTGSYDIDTIARQLGGNVVALVTEIDIVRNDLFGEKIAFVNIPGVTYTTLPVEERNIVFMVVYFDDDVWLVQVDYASYHRMKPTMKQRFASYYEI